MKILITGATGLIGSKLSSLLIENGHTVHYLTTSKHKIKQEEFYKGFYWEPSSDQIDTDAFEGISAIINLVGATIAKRWTKSYKKTILESRIKTTYLLYKTLESLNHNVEHFISASGISIYPTSETKLYTEENIEVDSNFLAQVVVKWEAAADLFKNLGIDVAKVRTGVVFDSNEGAFPKLIQPIRYNVGAALGNGKQWQSWIHIDDIVGIYSFITERKLEGIFNAVAPSPIRNEKLTRLIANRIEKTLWLPNAPGFILKLALGEMAILLLKGQLVSSKKIEQFGYTFKHYNVVSALDDLL